MKKHSNNVDSVSQNLFALAGDVDEQEKVIVELCNGRSFFNDDGSSEQPSSGTTCLPIHISGCSKVSKMKCRNCNRILRSKLLTQCCHIVHSYWYVNVVKLY